MDKHSLIEKLQYLETMISSCEYSSAASKYSPEEVRGHGSYIRSAIDGIVLNNDKPTPTLLSNLNRLHKEYKGFHDIAINK